MAIPGVPRRAWDSATSVDPLLAAAASMNEYTDEMLGPPLEERTWSAAESDAFFQGICARALFDLHEERRNADR